jgi:hypothetical protein
MKTPTIVTAVLCGCINAASARDVASSTRAQRHMGNCIKARRALDLWGAE